MTGDLSKAYSVTNKSVDRKILKLIEVLNDYILVDELQGEPEFIAQKKVKLAAGHVDHPVIIEDVSLCFNAFKGLPGPYM